MRRRDLLMNSAALLALAMAGQPAAANPALVGALVVNLGRIILATGAVAEAINATVALGRTIFDWAGGDAQASEKDALKSEAAAAMYATIRAARHYWASTRNAEISLGQFQEKGFRPEHWRAFLHYTKAAVKQADILRIRLKQHREYFDKAIWPSIDELEHLVGVIQKAQELIVEMEAHAPPTGDDRQRLLELYKQVHVMQTRAADLMVAIERYADTRPTIIPT